MDYTADMVLRVAQRHRNEKRGYLLVNPLQGKHMPVPPHAALDMMAALGRRVAAQHPEARLVIGFAETATAIGGIVAEEISSACTYIQTTREKPADVSRWIEFMEEHSHAPEQRLAADALEEALARTDTVVFVDDELSTGRTLCNIIVQMRAALPALCGKKLVAASLLNRLTEADTARLRAHGAESIALLHLPEGDYEARAAGIAAHAPEVCAPEGAIPCRRLVLPSCRTPRTGVMIGDYMAHWREEGHRLAATLPWGAEERVLVLGTEECMLPGLLLGRAVEERGAGAVFFHATTRSPIGIAAAEGYPIRAGWQLQSFYEAGRTTYIYNLEPYDHVLIVTDAEQAAEDGVQSLVTALGRSGSTDIVCLTAGGCGRDE